MTRLYAILRIIAPMVAAAVTAITPFYGKYHWFIAAVAAANALGLAAPGLLPSSTTKTP